MSKSDVTTPLTRRERAAIYILLFIVTLINPTGYTHHIDKLRDEIKEALNA